MRPDHIYSSLNTPAEIPSDIHTPSVLKSLRGNIFDLILKLDIMKYELFITDRLHLLQLLQTKKTPQISAHPSRIVALRD